MARPRSDMVDSWAGNPRHARAKDYMCFKNKLKIYFPVDEPNAPEWFGRLQDVVNQVFGGSTVYDAEGSWWSSKQKRTIIEPVKVIEIAHSCHSREQVRIVADAVAEAAVATRQEAISVDTNQFHIIPTEHMLTPGSIMKPGDEW